MINEVNEQICEEKEINRKLKGGNENTPNSPGVFEKMTPPEKMDFYRNTAIVKFTSIGRFSRKLGVTRSMGSQLLSGTYLPLKPKTIQRIADVLQVNVILLAQTYSELRESKK